MIYTDREKAIHDLKESFLTADVSQVKHTEGLYQAMAVQALENMSTKELLSLANDKVLFPLEKLWTAYHFQNTINKNYARKEPSVPKKNFRAFIPLLKQNKQLLKECSEQERIQYVRAYQEMYQYIENFPEFKRPLEAKENLQYRQEILNGLMIADPHGLIETVRDLQEKQPENLENTFEAFALLSQTAQGEHLEQQAIHNDMISKTAAIASIGFAAATIPVAKHVDQKYHHTASHIGGGLFVMAGLVSLIYLIKQTKKFKKLSDIYGYTTRKLASNAHVRMPYHQMKPLQKD